VGNAWAHTKIIEVFLVDYFSFHNDPYRHSFSSPGRESLNFDGDSAAEFFPAVTRPLLLPLLSLLPYSLEQALLFSCCLSESLGSRRSGMSSDLSPL
jgi:hypothetical protein